MRTTNRRSSIKEDTVKRAVKPAFKAELDSMYTFRWPVLSPAETTVVMTELQREPLLRQLTQCNRSRTETSRKRRKLSVATPARVQRMTRAPTGAPAGMSTGQDRQTARRQRALERTASQMLEREAFGAAVVTGLNSVCRACHAGRATALVVCRDGIRPGSSAAVMAQQLPALCVPASIVLCCLNKKTADSAMLGGVFL